MHSRTGQRIAAGLQHRLPAIIFCRSYIYGFLYSLHPLRFLGCSPEADRLIDAWISHYGLVDLLLVLEIRGHL